MCATKFGSTPYTQPTLLSLISFLPSRHSDTLVGDEEWFGNFWLEFIRVFAMFCGAGNIGILRVGNKGGRAEGFGD